MKAVIAHRLASYADAIRQILSSYEIESEGVSDFTELSNTIALNNYDAIIIPEI